MKTFDGYKKGVDLGGWLSQCSHEKAHYDSFISRSDIDKIASWGLDHVRLPIDYDLVEDDNGNVIEGGYSYIDSAIEWCGGAGLKLVLDLHKTAGFSFDKGEGESGFFDSEALQERFYILWERLAKRYGKYHERVAFELLNEVTDREFIGAWNDIVGKCVPKIRAIAPDTTIIVGSYGNNSPDALPELVLPDDSNMVLSFHCYDPLEFTHQGGVWVEGMSPDFRMAFDEKKITEEFFVECFAKAIETAKKYDVPLYCGEYGVIDRVKPQDVLKWYKAINSAFNQFGISHCAWSYKQMDFGLSDEWISPVIEELVKYL
ncbi:MAG: glycoside hydrolase family 5 protein [Clostridium sp.]|nr:glycoside hydrolase family 5 protein [Clostridium sp.]MCM1172790.1 glycoside hydrolase family 5 protein [Clostridium sp.]MCM1208177.1 glycoside hydrolase family 5 protein [Ruminococcus sp.]